MANILVVDDEHALRRLIAKWLLIAGYDVLEAESGAQATEIARQTYISLVIMDVNLPDMTGFGAIERIRSIPGLATIPIICLTGLDMRIDVAHEGGCTDLLLKPVERKVFMAAVDRLLRPAAKPSTSDQAG